MEFKTVLRFPDYFGANWDALEDCLTDLAWWPAAAYILVITDASEILAAESPSEFRLLLRIMRAVAGRWSEPEALPDGTERPATPFHVVFFVQPTEVERLRGRLTALGAIGNFGRLEPP